MQALERSLRTRPPMPPAKFMANLPVARGEHEVGWVGLALAQTLEEIREAVRAHGADPPSGEPSATKCSLLSMSREQQGRLDAAIARVRRLDGFAAPEWGLLERICQEHMGGPPENPPDLPPVKLEGSCAAGRKEDPRAYGREVQRQIRAVEEANRFPEGPADFAGIEESGGNAQALGALARWIANALRCRDAAFGVVRSLRVARRARDALRRRPRSESPLGSPHPLRSRPAKRRPFADFRTGRLSTEQMRLLVRDGAANRGVGEETIQHAEQTPSRRCGESTARRNNGRTVHSASGGRGGPTRHGGPSGPESRPRKPSRGRRKEKG